MFKKFKKADPKTGSMKSVYTSYRPDFASDFGPLKPKRRFIKWILISVVTLAGLIVIAAGFLYWYVMGTPIKGETSGRTNILILGIDDTAKLADTIMLVSIDQSRNPEVAAALVSIPRDLYVPIPGNGSAKINAAYSYGENNGYPGGGVALTKSTIEELFDIPIHYYVTLDFSGFIKAVDAVGGVTVNVPDNLIDPFYPTTNKGTTTFSIKKGLQQLDGETALKYARSRKTTSDFDRAARQQQVSLAFRDKVVTLDTLLTSKKRNALLEVYREHIVTNLEMRQLIKIGKILNDRRDKKITRHVLHNGQNGLLISGTNETGSVQLPKSGNWSEIRSFIKNVLKKTSDSLPQRN